MADSVKTKQLKADMPFPPELFEMAAVPDLLFVFCDERRVIVWGCKEQKWLQ